MNLVSTCKYFIEKQMCNKNTFRIRSYISIYTTHTKIKVSSKVYPLQQQCHPSKANTTIRIMFTLWFYLPKIEVRQIFFIDFNQATKLRNATKILIIPLFFFLTITSINPKKEHTATDPHRKSWRFWIGD